MGRDDHPIAVRHSENARAGMRMGGFFCSDINANTNTICSCESGLEDMTHSQWRNVVRPRPPQLNFAGWCNWCAWCGGLRRVE